MKSRSMYWDRYDGEPFVPERGDLVFGPQALYEVLDARPVDSVQHDDRWRLQLRRIGDNGPDMLDHLCDTARSSGARPPHPQHRPAAPRAGRAGRTAGIVMPERIQLRRSKGWRKPANTVVVARPSRWGNPYLVAELGEVAVEYFERDLRAGKLAISIDDVRAELAGHNLACWCALGAVCHADVLLEVANS